jgi:hypothetical protein
MNRTFNILSRTESAATAISASLLSVVTIGAVMALFSTATPDAVNPELISFDTVVITAHKNS